VHRKASATATGQRVDGSVTAETPQVGDQSLGNKRDTSGCKTTGVERVRVMRIIARMNVGGPAVQISGLMRNLDPTRFEQVLVTGFCSEDEADFLETQALDVPALRVSGLGRSISAIDDGRALRSLSAQIRHFRPHIVHTHTAKAGVLGRLAATLKGNRPEIVHTFHGHLLSGYFSPTKTRAVVMVEKALARRTHSLVAVGERVRDDLLSAGIGRVDQYSVIPPGVALSTLPPLHSARRQLDIAPESFVVGFLGRLTGIKRPDRLVDVARLLKEGYPNLVFLVAGDGSEAPMLQQAASNERLPIKLLGWRSDIETVLAACDAMILTSDNEGTPLSLIQAGLAGLPVVSTRVGSVAEIVRDGHTGLLTDRDPEQLARALGVLVDDAALRSDLGNEARTWTSENYGVKRLAEDHARLYDSLIG